MSTKAAAKDQIKNLSDNEIRALIQKYPYYQNLYHVLLENNIELEGTDLFQNILHQASLHSVDREFLFRKVRSLKAELQLNKLDLMKLAEQNEALETIDLPSLEEEVLQAGIVQEELKQAELSVPLANDPTVSDDDIDTDLEDRFSIGTEKMMPGEDRSSETSMLEKIIAHGREEEKAFEIDDQRLEFLTAFSKTLDSKTIILNPNLSKTKTDKQTGSKDGSLELEITNLESQNPSPALKARKLKKAFNRRLADETNEDIEGVSEFIEKSVMESHEVASETLAELLVTQEQYDKAIRMYERLKQMQPDKKGYFEDKISRLSKLS